MRDFHRPGRSAVHAAHAMVATSQPAATLAGLDVLRAGGNAIDAAVAACAVLCVVEPESTGIGGDCFCLYVPAGSDRPIAINGSGFAPKAAAAEWFLERGINGIGQESPHAVTVPGAVDAWSRLLEDHGRKGLDELLQPAIRYAEQGFHLHGRVAWDFMVEGGKLSPEAAAVMMPGGKAPREGDRLCQPALAKTLRAIAAKGRDGFYLGEVAEDIVGHLNGLGGLHTLDDFAAYRSEYVEPISTEYRGHRLWECPPNGSGIVALMILNLLEGFTPTDDPLSPDRMHRLIEATRLAYRDRDTFVADPRQADVPVEHLLSRDYADKLRAGIAMDRAASSLPPPGMPKHEDTVYLCVVDQDGNAVSFINSLFKSFGTGIMAPKSGVLLQNRGFGFVIEPGHRNCIAPRKRPLHTIIPAMLTKDGRVQMTYGVMGGHYQPVGHSWVLSSMLDHGLDIQAAIDLPRLFAYEGVVELETGIGEAAKADLEARGHKTKWITKPHGGGQGIWIDHERGVLVGGSDPRKDGMALGW